MTNHEHRVVLAVWRNWRWLVIGLVPFIITFMTWMVQLRMLDEMRAMRRDITENLLVVLARMEAKIDLLNAPR